MVNHYGSHNVTVPVTTYIVSFDQEKATIYLIISILEMMRNLKNGLLCDVMN